MLQRRWLEGITDYDLEIIYHPGKANKLANTLGRRPRFLVNAIIPVPREIYREIQSLGLEICSHSEIGQYLGAMTIQSTLFDRIIEALLEDPEIVELIHETVVFGIGEKGELRMNARPCVPNQPTLRNEILREGHQSLFHLHPRRDKIIEEIQELFWRKGLRKDVSEFVSMCLVC